MKNKYKIYLSIGVILSVMTLFTIFALRQEAQTTQQNQDDPPSRVQRGIMTERQVKHSRLYETNTRPGKDLVKLAHKANEDLVVYMPGENNLPADGRPLPTQTEFIQGIACESDLIVVGQIVSKSSQLTARAKYVFTDYELSIIEIVSTRLPVNIQPANVISITELGGAVEIESRKIDFIIKSKKRYRVSGVYLLFLKYLPESASYKIIKKEGGFEISENTIRRFSNAPSPYLVTDERIDTFLNSVRTGVTQCSGRGG